MRLLVSAFLALFLTQVISYSHADLILPRPLPRPEEGNPKAVRLRIVNRNARPIYLQGMRQDPNRIDRDRLVLNVFYRGASGGWQPFLDYLPCDLPQCHEMGGPREGCPKGAPIAIPLGPAGGANAVYDVLWEGKLYERTEAIFEEKRGEYCYRPFVPAGGTLRIEVEYSETISDEPADPGDNGHGGRIGPRDKSAIEFSLPPAEPVMEIFVPTAPRGEGSPKVAPR
jgi:hypothetical protein